MRSLNTTRTHTHVLPLFACMDWVSSIFSCFPVSVLSSFFSPAELFLPQASCISVTLIQRSANISPINMISFQLVWCAVDERLSVWFFLGSLQRLRLFYERHYVASMESRKISTKLDYFKQILCFSTHRHTHITRISSECRTLYVPSEKRKNDDKKKWHSQRCQTMAQ